uniref:Uncharacterized protein n=1 Tax=Lotus japonicus TaxID=34305 RepID=I3STI2_LOTJA|nr:unknown [Lotus japonicus]
MCWLLWRAINKNYPVTTTLSCPLSFWSLSECMSFLKGHYACALLNAPKAKDSLILTCW